MMSKLRALPMAAIMMAAVMHAVLASAWAEDPPFNTAGPRFTQPAGYQDPVMPLPAVTPAAQPGWPSAGSAQVPAESLLPPSWQPGGQAPVANKNETLSPDATRRFEATWYDRVDYFQWDEWVHRHSFVRETGVLPTLGYMRRSGQERFRAEFFGSKVGYRSDIQFDDGLMATVSSHTDLIGLRAEYDFMWEPSRLPKVSVFGGVGTRFWIRNLPDTEVDPTHLVFGYQETWWTFYPYVGMEKRRTMRPEIEFYWRERVGMMAFTYEHASTVDDLRLFPKQGITVQSEMGWRGPRFFVAGTFELMQWSHSAVVRDAMQPHSQLALVGLKSGFSF